MHTKWGFRAKEELRQPYESCNPQNCSMPSGAIPAIPTIVWMNFTESRDDHYDRGSYRNKPAPVTMQTYGFGGKANKESAQAQRVDLAPASRLDRIPNAAGECHALQGPQSGTKSRARDLSLNAASRRGIRVPGNCFEFFGSIRPNLEAGKTCELRFNINERNLKF